MSLRVLLTAFICLALSNQMRAQEVHSPSELLEIINASELIYQIEIAEGQINQETFERVNNNYYYQEFDSEGLSIAEYIFEGEDSTTLVLAEQHFAKSDMIAARKSYQQVLDRQPRAAILMTYIGQTYGIQEDWDNAAAWYRKAIEANYIDYMAHWFLADVLSKQERHEEAAEEITLAYVLNRNNPRLLTAMKRLYGEAKLDYQEWEFDPNYTLTPLMTGEPTVVLTADENWLGYAIAKAVWTYEPGYRKRMTGSDEDNFSSLEEREAILALVINNAKNGKIKKSKEIPSLIYLKKALDQELLSSFIFVEIWSRQYPLIAYTQSPAVIRQLAAYVKLVRSEKP